MREALGEDKTVCRDGKRGVVMKAAPAAAIEMVQPELLLQFLVVALDAPAQLRTAAKREANGAFVPSRQVMVFHWPGFKDRDRKSVV